MSAFQQVRSYKLQVLDERPEFIGVLMDTVCDPDEMLAMLNEMLGEFPARDPVASSWRQFGFGTVEDGFAQLCDKTVVIDVEIRERLLPGAVLRREVAKRVSKIASMEHRTLRKNEIAQIKDEVCGELLPKSHIQVKTVPLAITPHDDHLIIRAFSSSAKVCEDVFSFIRTAFSSWPAVPLLNELDVEFTEILRSIAQGEHAANREYLLPVNCGTFVNSDDTVTTYKGVDDDTWSDAVEALDSECEVKKIKLRKLNDGCYFEFVINASGSISGIKFDTMTSDITDDEGWRAELFIVLHALDDLHTSFAKVREALYKSEGENDDDDDDDDEL